MLVSLECCFGLHTAVDLLKLHVELAGSATENPDVLLGSNGHSSPIWRQCKTAGDCIRELSRGQQVRLLSLLVFNWNDSAVPSRSH